MASRSARLFVLGIGFGCADRQVALISEELSEASVVAFVDGNEQLAQASLVPSGHSWVVPGELPQKVLVWPLRTEDFVDSAGERLTAEGLIDVRVGLASEPPVESYGSCRRCLAPSGTPPQIVFSGDSCTPPIFRTPDVWEITIEGHQRLDVVENAELIEATRERLRIQRPGPCACSPPPPDHTHKVETAVMVSDPQRPDPWPLTALAAGSDGSWAGFAQHYAVIETADGRRVESMKPMLFPGTPISAIALPPGKNGPRFAVSAATPAYRARGGLEPNLHGESVVELVGGRIETVELGIRGMPFDETIIFRFVPLRHDRIGIVGQGYVADVLFVSGLIPFAAECDVRENTLVCDPLPTLEGCRRADKDFALDLVELPEGDRLVLINQEGFGILSDQSWLCWRGATHVHAALAAFDRLFLCTSDGPESRVVRTSVTGTVAILGPAAWETALELPRDISSCTLSLREAPVPTDSRLRVNAGTLVAELSANGDVVTPLHGFEDLQPEMRGTHTSFETADGTSWAFSSWLPLAQPSRIGPRTWTDRVFKKPRESMKYEGVYGNETYSFDLAFLLPHEDGVIAVHGGAQIVLARTTSASTSNLLYPRPPPELDNDGIIVTGAAVDSNTGEIMLVGNRWADAAVGLAVRVQVEENSSSLVSLPPDTPGLLAIVEVLPGSFVIASTSGSLLWLEGDSATEISEVNPDPITHKSSIDVVSSLSAAHGIAWATGDRRIDRVFPPSSQHPSPRVEAFDPSRSELTTSQVDRWGPGIMAICPDHLVLASNGSMMETAPVRITDQSVRQARRMGDLRLVPFAGTPPSSDIPMLNAMWVRRENELMVFQRPHTELMAHGILQPPMPFPVSSAAVDHEGRVFVGGHIQRLAVLTSE
ncbi:MAG: hypothetical protein HYV07_05540 [Deltaproteobacteria bacterium]|nr:hypothetical protein [Deltaproteobacteria bacterium]